MVIRHPCPSGHQGHGHRADLAGHGSDHPLRHRMAEPTPPQAPGRPAQGPQVFRRKPATPGAFDFARWAYFKRLGGVGLGVGRAVRLAPGDLPPEAARSLSVWRWEPTERNSLR